MVVYHHQPGVSKWWSSAEWWDRENRCTADVQFLSRLPSFKWSHKSSSMCHPYYKFVISIKIVTQQTSSLLKRQVQEYAMVKSIMIRDSLFPSTSPSVFHNNAVTTFNFIATYLCITLHLHCFKCSDDSRCCKVFGWPLQTLLFNLFFSLQPL